MDAYDTLRDRARSKRQAAIRKAQAECRAALRKINELERKVGNGGPAPDEGNRAKSARILALAQSLIPKDQEFTLADMTAWLREAEPTRRFPIPTIRATFRRLADMGLIRPTSRGYAAEVSWMACNGQGKQDVPFAALSLPDAAERVLRDAGPMREVELALAIQHRGCRSRDPQRRVTKSLAIALRRNNERFTCANDGRWKIART
jgi:hypothetical protein